MNNLLFLGQTLFFDSLILSSVSWIIKRKIPIMQFIPALGISLAVTFILFLLDSILILAVPLLMVKIAFDPPTLKGYGIALAYFYTFFAFLSGVMHTLRYLVNFDLMHLSWILLFGVTIAVGVAVVFMAKSRFLRKVYTLGEFEHNVKFYCGDAEAFGIGFVDTGNSLIDKVTQLPVMIVPREKVAEIDYAIQKGKIPTWDLGFSVVGDDNAKMIAFRPTLLLIDDTIVKDVIVGLCETKFSKYDFLLQPEITVGRGVV